jgi:hypothetical protein
MSLSTQFQPSISSTSPTIQPTPRPSYLASSVSQITTVAGSGSTGSLGDGGVATAASLNLPAGIWCDAQNNLYIGEAAGQRIRKVSSSTKFITTLVGTGSSGQTGDNGQGTSATLSNPTQIFLTTSLNGLYFGEFTNAKVRFLDFDSGILTCFAGTVSGTSAGDGGKATSAVFNGITGVMQDTSSGLFYVSESYGNIVRLINTNNIISTFWGTGVAGISGTGGFATSAQINLPIQIYIDSSRVYVGVDGGCVVRVVSLSTSIVELFAGVTDSCVSSTVSGGATSSSLSTSISGVSGDDSGNIFLCESSGNKVRKVTTDSNMMIIAGMCELIFFQSSFC